MSTVPHRKVDVRIAGEDGNIFAIVGRVGSALKRSGQPEAAAELYARIPGTGSYHEALGVVMEYVNGAAAMGYTRRDDDGDEE